MGAGTAFLSLDHNDWLPLYLCLGNPTYSGKSGSSFDGSPSDARQTSTQAEVTLLSLEGVEDSDSDFSDEETWLAEDGEDPFTATDLAAERSKAQADPMCISHA